MLEKPLMVGKFWVILVKVTKLKFGLDWKNYMADNMEILYKDNELEIQSYDFIAEYSYGMVDFFIVALLFL